MRSTLLNNAYVVESPFLKSYWSLLKFFDSKIVDKKEIVCTLSNTGIYCSRDKYLV
jgi:hypothetical protein